MEYALSGHRESYGDNCLIVKSIGCLATNPKLLICLATGVYTSKQCDSSQNEMDYETCATGRVALTVGVVLGPVLNLSKSFQINCVKR